MVVALGVAVLWVVLAGGSGRAARSLRRPAPQAWKVYVWEWGPVGHQPAQFEALVNATDAPAAAQRARELLVEHQRRPGLGPATRCIPFSPAVHEVEELIPRHDRDRASLPRWAWPAP